MADERHHGWANRETWQVVNWIDSDGSYAVADGETTQELADRIRADHVEAAGERLPEAGVLQDLLAASLESVDWLAVAERVRATEA